MLPAKRNDAVLEFFEGEDRPESGTVEHNFERLVRALALGLLLLGRDPDVVLQADRRLLKVRLRLTLPPDEAWHPFRFHPTLLEGPTAPEDRAVETLTAWRCASVGLED